MDLSESGEQSGLAHLLIAHKHQLHALIRLGTVSRKMGIFIKKIIYI